MQSAVESRERRAALPGPPEDQWDRLAAASSSIFGTRAWAECWWSHLGSGSRPHVVVDEDGGPDGPRFLLPLAVSGRPLRQVRFLGHGPADSLGPLCAPEHRPAAAAALRGVLRDPRVRAHVLLAQDVPEAHGWDGLLGGTVVRGVASPTVDLGASSWDAWLAGRSKNFREQVRRRERKLRKTFDVRFRLADESTLPVDLETLFRLHQIRWGADAPFANGALRAFSEAFAGEALRRGWLRLWLLELDGRPVAALHGFRFAGAESFYQSGRDPGLDEHSVGFVLLAHALREAVQDGIGEYRLLRGDEAYKSRFADGDDAVHTVALAGGVAGRAAVALARRRAA